MTDNYIAHALTSSILLKKQFYICLLKCQLSNIAKYCVSSIEISSTGF